jgi:drug/metabolite transporter (DMT)-like permease
MKERKKAYLNLTLAMAISGSAVVVSKKMVNTIPTFLATELGVFLGLVILSVVTFGIKKEFHRLNKRTLLLFIAQAVCGIFLYRILTFVGLRYTSAANSGLITSSSPAIVVILAYIILRERITKRGVIGLILVLSGLVAINLYTFILEGSFKNSMVGNLFIFVSVIVEALFSILSKVKCMEVSPIYRTTVLVFIAFICLLPLAVKDALTYDFSAMPPATIGCIIYYGIFVTYLSYVFWFRGIAKVKAYEAAPFTSMVPGCSILLAAIFLKEEIQWVHILGMSLIVSGILISSSRQDGKLRQEVMQEEV